VCRKLKIKISLDVDSGKGIALVAIMQSNFDFSANAGQRQLARRWCLKMLPTSLCAKVFPAELSPDDGRQALSNSEWKAISKWTHKIKSVKQVLRANCLSFLQSDTSPSAKQTGSCKIANSPVPDPVDLCDDEANAGNDFVFGTQQTQTFSGKEAASIADPDYATVRLPPPLLS
jgi:hypothetical protein